MRKHLYLFASLLSLAIAAPSADRNALSLRDLVERDTAEICSAPEGGGVCVTSGCSGIVSNTTGLCSDTPDDGLICCVEPIENIGLIETASAAASADRAPELAAAAAVSCKTRLSCGFAQIQAMSMTERLSYVRYMQSSHLYRLNCGNQYRAIEGVIAFFQSNNLARPGTWASYVDAGIVEGIQRGGAIALGYSSATGGNPGAAKWADFMRKMRDGRLGNRGDHDKTWSIAEQTSTDYGRAVASRNNKNPSLHERAWFGFSQLFRLMMRHRTTSLILLPDAFFNWLTDVTIQRPAQCGSQFAWNATGSLIPLFPGIAEIARQVYYLLQLKRNCFD